MKFSTYVTTPLDIERCEKAKGVVEVLIEPALLAQQGKLSKEDVEGLISLVHETSLKPVLVWDILMTDSSFHQVCDELRAWDFGCFGATRVKDLGAADWMQSNHPDVPIQLLLEGSSHNLEAIKGWVEYFGSQLEKIVLSIELPEKKLIQYCEQVPVKFEVLGAGPILLFYSPRYLLSRVLAPEDDDTNAEFWMDAVASSEEFQGRAFVTKQTPHGTLMFLDKDQFILDKLEKLDAAGIDTVRIDLHHLSESRDATDGIDEICQLVWENAPSVRRRWPRRTLTPFFRANATSKQFERCKSKLHMLRDETCLAQVISGARRKFLAIYSLRAFDPSQKKSMVLPSGEELDFPDVEFRDSRGVVVEQCEADSILIVPWIRKACSGALIRGLGD